jgi:PEP-CTERM motif-containing protein
MLRWCLSYVVLTLVLAVPGFATTILINQWYVGLWNPTNQQLTDDVAYIGSLGTSIADPGSAPWTFNSPISSLLVISDLSKDGDSFDVFDNGSPIGSTSVPTDDGAQCGDDPLGCTDPKWSHGSFGLLPGSHSITMVIKTNASGSDRGNNVFMVSADVPEPGTTFLAGCGVLLLLWRRRTSWKAA